MTQTPPHNGQHNSAQGGREYSPYDQPQQGSAQQHVQTAHSAQSANDGQWGPSGATAAPNGSTIPSSSQPGVVGVGSVAGPVAEYIDIPGKGAVQLASMSSRLIARLIDSVLLSVVSIILFVLAIAIFAGLLGVDDSGDSAGAFTLFVIFFAPLYFVALYLYEAVMIGVKGATVGKMVMKIKAVKPRNGQVPGLGAGFVRFLIPGLCGLIPFIGGLGSLVCLISPTFDSSGRRQGWHDKVANTVVVSSK